MQTFVAVIKQRIRCIAATISSDSLSAIRQNRMMVDIRMSNGLHIQQRGLDYGSLKRLVGNLEVLC